MDFLQVTSGEEEVQERLSLAGRALPQVLRTKEGIPILDEGRHRHGGREFLARQEFKQSIGSSPLRFGGGHKNAGIENNAHRMAKLSGDNGAGKDAAPDQGPIAAGPQPDDFGKVAL
jgi:hypothetical protein